MPRKKTLPNYYTHICMSPTYRKFLTITQLVIYNIWLPKFIHIQKELEISFLNVEILI